MPLLYEPSTWLIADDTSCARLTSRKAQNTSPTSNRMPSLNLFRRKSNKTATTPKSPQTSVDRAVSGLGRMSLNTQSKQAALPTRRPHNLPSVNNPFSHSNNISNQPSEPPPSYSAAAPTIAPSTDNRFSFLSKFDTVFLIDDSGSMAGARWRETAAALSAITPICTAHDHDGIDIYFLNTPDDERRFRNITSAEKVQEIFTRVRPGRGTPTGSRLNSILRPYLQKCEQLGEERLQEENGDFKPLNVIVITDGEAHDDVESVVLSAAKRLDRLQAPAWQLGIQFFQVGSDPEATQALQELDDGLLELGSGRDIVDTVPWKGADSGIEGLNAEGILKVVLGAVNRRLDRKRNSAEWRP